MANTFLGLYNKWITTERLPYHGICTSLTVNNLSVHHYLKPNSKEEEILQREDGGTIYWAAGVHTDHPDRLFKFTPLRQTIILLCAALNGEFD